VHNPNNSVARFNRGEHRGNQRQAVGTIECQDWLAEYLGRARYQAKEVGELSGCGVRAAENIKQGRNGMTMAHLVAMCRNDPMFRAEFFRFCGGHLEVDPEFVAGLSMAVNSYVRKQAPEHVR